MTHDDFLSYSSPRMISEKLQKAVSFLGNISLEKDRRRRLSRYSEEDEKAYG